MLFDEKYWFSGLLCACLAHSFHISRKARSFDSKHKGFSSNNSFEPWSVILLSVLCYYSFKAEEEEKKNENEDEEEEQEEEEEQVKILKESELCPERKPSNSDMKPQAC